MSNVFAIYWAKRMGDLVDFGAARDPDSSDLTSTDPFAPLPPELLPGILEPLPVVDLIAAYESSAAVQAYCQQTTLLRDRVREQSSFDVSAYNIETVCRIGRWIKQSGCRSTPTATVALRLDDMITILVDGTICVGMQPIDTGFIGGCQPNPKLSFFLRHDGQVWAKGWGCPLVQLTSTQHLDVVKMVYTGPAILFLTAAGNVYSLRTADALHDELCCRCTGVVDIYAEPAHSSNVIVYPKKVHVYSSLLHWSRDVAVPETVIDVAGLDDYVFILTAQHVYKVQLYSRQVAIAELTLQPDDRVLCLWLNQVVVSRRGAGSHRGSTGSRRGSKGSRSTGSRRVTIKC